MTEEILAWNGTNGIRVGISWKYMGLRATSNKHDEEHLQISSPPIGNVSEWFNIYVFQISMNTVNHSKLFQARNHAKENAYLSLHKEILYMDG